MKTHSTLPTGALAWLVVIALGTVILAGVGIAAAWRWLGRWWWIAVMVVVLVIAAGIAFAQAGSHGAGHAENHDWYKDLKQPGTGYSCCNGSSPGIEGDCRPTRAYLDDDGIWQALINGKWTPVPPRVVLNQLAPDGGSHICVSKSGYIYCFLGGSPQS